MSIRDQVVKALLTIDHPVTAAQIHRRLQQNVGTTTSLATLSGVLSKMTRSGELVRVEEFGPRSGYGYSIPKPSTLVALPRNKLVELLYLLMRDATPTGEVVRIVHMIDVKSTDQIIFTSPELQAYAERLAGELLR